jgi:putative pre-16S rRNA nuclease
MRVLGVDFGMARIGLAVGESEVKISSMRPPMQATGSLKKDAMRIFEFAKKEDCKLVVLGVPEQEEPQDGGRMQRICRMLGDQINLLGMEALLVDESLSTVQSEQDLRDQGLKASQVKKYKDGVSAQIVLERYFEGSAV